VTPRRTRLAMRPYRAVLLRTTDESQGVGGSLSLGTITESPDHLRAACRKPMKASVWTCRLRATGVTKAPASARPGPEQGQLEIPLDRDATSAVRASGLVRGPQNDNGSARAEFACKSPSFKSGVAAARAGPRPVLGGSEAPTSCADRKTRQLAGPFRKRLMGFEPSTFCMANRG